MKILLATDGSDYSEGAAQFLTRLDFSPADEIAIVNVINWVPIMSEWETLYPDFQEIRREIAPKVLDSASNILKTVRAKISSSYVEGYADKSIVDTAVDVGADLVVLGARGLRGIKSRFVGSVTKLVALKSPKPVLIVKPPQQEISGNIKILLATDGSVHSDAIAKVLSSIPFPDDTEITIMYVIFSAFSDIPERFAMEIDDRIKASIASAREKEFKESEEVIAKTREYVGNRFSKIHDITRSGFPSTEILNTADSSNIDIIVVGSSGMRGIKGMLGSVSRNILNQSQCSVLIGKTG
ncbi:MAG: universal stress protein [Thermodesulfovibrionia bacterium]|nr:universal stress protein [Thermodesulfovibrionia bacterium]